MPLPRTVRALAFNAPWTSKVPLLTVVLPVKPFMLPIVSVPVLVLFNVIAPSSEPLPLKV